MMKMTGIAVALALGLGLMVWLHGHARYNEGRASMKAEWAQAMEHAYQESRKNHEKKKQEVLRLDDAHLVNRYCRWVYDVSHDNCVRDHLSFQSIKTDPR